MHADMHVCMPVSMYVYGPRQLSLTKNLYCFSTSPLAANTS